MDRGAWWAIVHGVARVRHNLVTKQQIYIYVYIYIYIYIYNGLIYSLAHPMRWELSLSHFVDEEIGGQIG